MIKNIEGKSFIWHVGVFFTSVAFVILLIATGLWVVSVSPRELAEKYSKFSFKSYYFQFQNDEDQAFHALKYTLENGDIALFGSSELTSNQSRFTPYEFFPKNLGKNLRGFGHGGFQSKAIATELLSVISPQILENGRVVVMISPSWFLDGAGMNEGLWNKEVASIVILSRINNNEYVDKEIKKRLLGEKKRNLLNYMIDRALVKITDRKFVGILADLNTTVPVKKLIEWDKWKKESKEFEVNISTNNEYGINDKYYDLYMKPIVGTKAFPITLTASSNISENKEIRDFELLLEILKKFKNKPLIVFLPLNRKAYRNLEVLDPVISYLETRVQANQFPYLNFWFRPFDRGVLTDIMHNGAYGWVLINEFIYQNDLK